MYAVDLEEVSTVKNEIIHCNSIVIFFPIASNFLVLDSRSRKGNITRIQEMEKAPRIAPNADP